MRYFASFPFILFRFPLFRCYANLLCVTNCFLGTVKFWPRFSLLKKFWHIQYLIVLVSITSMFCAFEPQLEPVVFFSKLFLNLLKIEQNIYTHYTEKGTLPISASLQESACSDKVLIEVVVKSVLSFTCCYVFPSAVIQFVD